jgi:hypothetical protein
MIPKNDHYETEATSNDSNTFKTVKARRLSGNMVKKDINEDSVEANDEDPAKATAHFNSYTLEKRDGNVRKYNELNDEYDPVMTINEELLQYQPLKSQTSRHEKISHPIPRPNKENISTKGSSRHPKIPKDPSTNKRFEMHSNRIKRSQLHKNKTHQLSINLRKGSPVQAEVDLYPSKSIVKNPLDRLGKNDNQSVCLSKFDVDNINNKATERKHNNGHVSKLSVDDNINELKSQRNVPIVASNRLSFSSNDNSTIPIDFNSNEKIDFADKMPSNRYDIHDDSLFGCMKEDIEAYKKDDHTSGYVYESEDLAPNNDQSNYHDSTKLKPSDYNRHKRNSLMSISNKGDLKVEEEMNEKY